MAGLKKGVLTEKNPGFFCNLLGRLVFFGLTFSDWYKSGDFIYLELVSIHLATLLKTVKCSIVEKREKVLPLSYSTPPRKKTKGPPWCY